MRGKIYLDFFFSFRNHHNIYILTVTRLFKKHDNEILNLMEEEDDFEQEENLQTKFAIYFKNCYFR